MLIFYPSETTTRRLENERYYDDHYDMGMYDDVFTAQSSKTEENDEQNKFETNHPGLAIFVYFCNAFIVAAFVEELSKYFGEAYIFHQ